MTHFALPLPRQMHRCMVCIVLAVLFCCSPTAAVAIVPQSELLSPEQIREASKQVMQQPDYRSVRRRILENIVAEDTSRSGDGFLQKTLRSMGTSIGDFFDWIFSGFFNTGGGGRAARPAPVKVAPQTSGGSFDFSLGKLLLFVSLGILVATLIWLFSGILKASDGRREIDKRKLFGDDEEDLANLSVPPGELAASTYETRAIKLASEGNYRSAIRELLLGSMSWIERAGMIRFRKGLTNRDYIRAVWRKEDQRFAFGRTALQFERVNFGRREATREMFETCLQAFQGTFHEDSTTQTR